MSDWFVNLKLKQLLTNWLNDIVIGTTPLPPYQDDIICEQPHLNWYSHLKVIEVAVNSEKMH